MGDQGMLYDVPWMSREQANARRLSTRRKIAKVQGYTDRSLCTWESKFDDFPRAVAVLISKPFRYERLYSVKDVVKWIEDAQFDGRIRYPQGPMPARKPL